MDFVPEPLQDLSLLLSSGAPMVSADPSGNDEPAGLVFGTVVRAAPIENGGELVLLDWSEKQVLKTVPMRPRNPTIGEDPDPRGNARGCRGVRWLDGQILAATYHTVEQYSPRLEPVGAINGNLMAGLHEVDITERGTIWVSSTAIDAAVEYDLTTQEQCQALWPREMPHLQEKMGLTPLPIDKSADNRLRFLDTSDTETSSHLHLNAVAEHEETVYALCNDHAAVVDLTNQRVAFQHEGLKGAHNLKIDAEGTALVNDTYGRAIQFFDLETGHRRRTIDLTDYQWVRELIRGHVPAYWGRRLAVRMRGKDGVVARPLFVRGLASYGKHLFVGISPASILQIDRSSGALVDAYQYSNDLKVCIHGLDVLPHFPQ